MNKLLTSTLRPGLLVSVKTSTRGNVSYETRDLAVEPPKGKAKLPQQAKSLLRTASRAFDKKTLAKIANDIEPSVAKWETTRRIDDPVEHEAAGAARSKARNLVASMCAKSAFGLLCPEEKNEELRQAISAAHEIVDEYNSGATLERINFYVMVGRIARDDEEAVRAINSEVRDLMADMTTGLKNLDKLAVREAANKLRSVGQMLSPDAQVRAQFAIDAAREAANKIKAAGEAVAVEIDTYAIRRITEQRTAFLDITSEAVVAKPKAKVRAVDVSPANIESEMLYGKTQMMGIVTKTKRARKLDLEKAGE